MDINGVLGIVLLVVFIGVGIALIVFLVELVKVLKKTKHTLEQADPTIKNVEAITTDIQPTLAKIGPLMDRVQLTVDSVNLEMMRVDQILEDVTEITDSATSATQAVDSITNAPIKAVNGLATRVRSKLTSHDASPESARLAEQRAAVADALSEYEEEPAPALKAEQPAEPKAEKPAGPKVPVPPAAEENEHTQPIPGLEINGEEVKTYVEIKENSDEALEIDPRVIAESSFFDDKADEE